LGCCSRCGRCASTCAAGTLVGGCRGGLAETCLVVGALQAGDEFDPRRLEIGQACLQRCHLGPQRCDFVLYLGEPRLVGFAHSGSALARALGVQLGVDLLELSPHRIA